MHPAKNPTALKFFKELNKNLTLERESVISDSAIFTKVDGFVFPKDMILLGDKTAKVIYKITAIGGVETTSSFNLVKEYRKKHPLVIPTAVALCQLELEAKTTTKCCTIQ